MLVLECFLDVLLRMPVKRGTPMQQTCPLSILHFDIGRTAAVHNANRIPIGHGAICHKSFEIRVFHSVAMHDSIQAPPKLYLNFCVLQLHITHCNGHYLLLLRVIHVAGHRGPVLHALDVVKHQPRIVQVPCRLHPPYEVHSTSRSFC